MHTYIQLYIYMEYDGKIVTITKHRLEAGDILDLCDPMPQKGKTMPSWIIKSNTKAFPPKKTL